MWRVIHGEGANPETAVLESIHQNSADAVERAKQVLLSDHSRSAIVLDENMAVAVALHWVHMIEEITVTEPKEIGAPLFKWLMQVQSRQPF